MDTSDPRRVITGSVLNVQRKSGRGLQDRQKYSKTVIIALFSLSEV